MKKNKNKEWKNNGGKCEWVKTWMNENKNMNLWNTMKERKVKNKSTKEWKWMSVWKNKNENVRMRRKRKEWKNEKKTRMRNKRKERNE